METVGPSRPRESSSAASSYRRLFPGLVDFPMDQVSCSSNGSSKPSKGAKGTKRKRHDASEIVSERLTTRSSKSTPGSSDQGSDNNTISCAPSHVPAGERIVLRDLPYIVDAAALDAYAATPEAGSTWAPPCDSDGARARMTEREYIAMFLRNVNPKPDGLGECAFSYVHSEIGQALVDANLLENGGRLYPEHDGRWPCVTQLGKKLRNCALGSSYVELDDSNAYHKYLQVLTTNQTAIAVLDELTDKSYRKRLAGHYFGDETKTEPIKQLFHMLSNDGSCADWRRSNKVKRSIPDHPLVARMERAMTEVAEELASSERGRAAIALLEERFPKKWKALQAGKSGKMRRKLVPRNAKLTWKSYLLQSLECIGLLTKMRVAREHGVTVGPPLHDGLFVDKHVDRQKLIDLCHTMSREIRMATGANVEVELKDVPSAPLDIAFQFPYDRDTFRDSDFRSNLHLQDERAIVHSLDVYNAWLSRFFVCILKQKKPEVVEIEYFEKTDRIKGFIPRSYDDTKKPYLFMEIYTNDSDKPTKLFDWFLDRNPARRRADKIKMWVTEQDRMEHPNDLNIFGGLPYDARFFDEGVPQRFAFVLPFPGGKEADWRSQEGLHFILWHIYYILCGGDDKAFKYVMHWFAFVIQKRQKPSTILVFYGEQGIGKSALVSINESGDGILPRIYGGLEMYFQTVYNIDHLLKDFNANNVNKLFCCLEEARGHKKSDRNNDQLGALISNQFLRAEFKGLDAIDIKDYRAFCCCTNNRDAFRITEGDRRHVMLEADSRFSLKSVREGRCTIENRMEYMTKLSDQTNEEVAYAFYKYCMQLDISEFKPQNMYETDLHREQQAANECALKAFLVAIRSREYDVNSYPFPATTTKDLKTCIFTSLQLLEHFKRYLQLSGLSSGIDNIKSLGWALKKYPDFVRKLDEGKCVKYAVQRGVGDD